MNETEWRTRKNRIDQRLRSLNPGWEIIHYRAGLDLTRLHGHAVEEFPTESGPADYAFFGGGRLLGLLEAKKVTVNPQNVLEQAKRYARGAGPGAGNWSGYRVPFLFASNGEILRALATGTGKTFLTVAQIYRLLESKFARRILFLVNRKALAAQAVREFNAFTTPQGNKFAQEYEVYSQRFQQEDFGEDEPFDPRVLPNAYLTAPKPSHTASHLRPHLQCPELRLPTG